MSDVYDETEEYVLLAGKTARLACEFVRRKTALSQAYKDGHKVTSGTANGLREQMHKAEDELDKAAEALESWLKLHGWPESEGK